MTYRLLDLFSGIGGFSLGLERSGGFKTVAFCEVDPFCRQVLRKHWPDVPIYDTAEASPARTSASQAKVQALKASAAAYGRSTPELLANYDPATSSWRTSQRCLVEGWTRFSETWPRSGLMRNGIAFQLPPLVRLTGATDCGLWPTPCANDDNKSPEAHMAMKQRMKGGQRNTITSLQVMVKAAERGLVPTPTAMDSRNARNRTSGRSNPSSKHHDGVTLCDFVTMWPTPSARDWKGAPASAATLPPNSRPLNEMVRFRTPQARDGMERGPSDPKRRVEQGHSVSLHDQIGGSLNPTWVEWLMGFPLGWTDCGPSATPSSRRSRK